MDKGRQLRLASLAANPAYVDLLEELRTKLALRQKDLLREEESKSILRLQREARGYSAAINDIQTIIQGLSKEFPAPGHDMI